MNETNRWSKPKSEKSADDIENQQQHAVEEHSKLQNESEQSSYHRADDRVQTPVAGSNLK